MEGEEPAVVDDLEGKIRNLNLKEEKAEHAENDEKVAELKAKFNLLLQKAKDKSRDGDLEGCLKLYKKAYKIHKSEKLARRIEKLESVLQESDDDDDDSNSEDGYAEVADGFKLSEYIYSKLYPYQKEGVTWFWKLFQEKKGGILGDDMGLGKTIQVISFLSGMFEQEHIKTALIVMPVSLLTNWEKEFKKWAPEIRVRNFHGSSQKQRSDNLARIQSRNGVCLTTYGLVNTCHAQFSQDKYGREFLWDYIILDEGHKIKNTANKTTQAIRSVPAANHFILTGTPIQNNLREMWALFDFVCEGKLLGTSRSFKQEYENPIVRARERDATAYEKRIGQEMSQHLRELIGPHFLRRTKALLENKSKNSADEVDADIPCNGGSSNEGSEDSKNEEQGKLTRKNDLIIWLYLSETQLQIYKDFLALDRVKEILMTTRSPLAELNVLKKICDHPRLLSTMACHQLGLNEEQDDVDYNEDYQWCAPPVEQLIQESGKMVFLVQLLQHLKKDGHRTLVFSQSRKMLDIVQKVLVDKGIKIMRVDGTVTSIVERESRINTFQTDPSFTVFLLTTQVGGVGLTLTAADRVVIVDPSWNPATDAQAVDRVYRIGQKNTVVIYRLITCGSLEEKIYRKQVFKQAITKQTTGSSKNPYRYFTRHELRDLFVLDDPRSSKTQVQLENMHSASRVSDEKLDEHIAFLYSTDIFGISDHDLLFSKEAVATQEELHAASEMGDVIQAKIRRAADIMRAESSQATPRGNHLLHDTPSSVSKKKNQTKIPDHLDIFKPSREDTKRFMPKKVQPNVRDCHDDVIDITMMDNEVDEDKLGEQLSAIKIKDEDHPKSQNNSTGIEPIVLNDSDNNIALDHGNSISGSSGNSFSDKPAPAGWDARAEDVLDDASGRPISELQQVPKTPEQKSSENRAESEAISRNGMSDDVITDKDSPNGSHNDCHDSDSSEKTDIVNVGDDDQGNIEVDSLEEGCGDKENSSEVSSSPREEEEEEDDDNDFGINWFKRMRRKQARNAFSDDSDVDEDGGETGEGVFGNKKPLNDVIVVEEDKTRKESENNGTDGDIQGGNSENNDVVLMEKPVTPEHTNENLRLRESAGSEARYRTVVLDSDESDGDEVSSKNATFSLTNHQTSVNHAEDEKQLANKFRDKFTSNTAAGGGEQDEHGNEQDDLCEVISSDQQEFYDAEKDAVDSQGRNGNVGGCVQRQIVVDSEDETEDSGNAGVEKIGDDDDREVVDSEDELGDGKDEIKDSEGERAEDSEENIRNSEVESVGNDEDRDEDIVDSEDIRDSDGGSRDSEEDLRNEEGSKDSGEDIKDSEEDIRGSEKDIRDNEEDIRDSEEDIRDSEEDIRDSEEDLRDSEEEKSGVSAAGETEGDEDERDVQDSAEDDSSQERSSEQCTDQSSSEDNSHGSKEDQLKESEPSDGSDGSDSGTASKKPSTKIRQVVSDGKSDEDDPGKENVPVDSSNAKLDNSASKTEKVLQPNNDNHPSGKTSCCPHGRHVSEKHDINRCPCIMTPEEQEAYKMHVNSARRYEKSQQLKLALNHFAKAYKLCDSDERLHQRIKKVYAILKAEHRK